MLLNVCDDALRAFRRQHAVSQADSEDLVGADGRIGRTPVNHVVQASVLLVPEETVEVLDRERRHGAIALLIGFFVSKSPGQILHNAKCVVPERLNFDWLSAARRYDPVPDLSVHPGQLDTGFSRGEQAAGIQFDSVTSAPNMPADNIRKHRIEFGADKF